MFTLRSAPSKKTLVSCPTITALPYHCRKLVLCALWSAICTVLLVAEFNCTDIIWCTDHPVPATKILFVCIVNDITAWYHLPTKLDCPLPLLKILYYVHCEVAGRWRDLSTEWRVLNGTCGMNCSHTVTFCFVLNVYCLQIKKETGIVCILNPKNQHVQKRIDMDYTKRLPRPKKKLISIWDFWLPHNTVIVFIMTIWFITLPWGMQSSIASSRSQARTKEEGEMGDDTVVPKWSVVCWVTDWVVWFGSSAVSNVCWRVWHTYIRPVNIQCWQWRIQNFIMGGRSRCQRLSLIHIWRCRRSTLCRSRWSPYH